MSKSIKLIDLFLKERTAHFPPTQQKMSFERHATYKTFGDFKYHLNMPDEWILNELPGTGRECWNCVGNIDHGDCDGFAMWRGIILGYCANCAKNYEGKRCRGFVGLGLESDLFEYQSAFDTYLGHVDFENYGCLADNEMHSMENRKCDLEERIDHFIAEVKAMFDEANKYTASTYGRICVYSKIYEIVNDNIDEFKHAPRLATLFDTIRTSILRNLSDVGTLTMKHGKDPEFLEAIVRLSNAMLSVLAKLGTA
jgi:hypothetical protein